MTATTQGRPPQRYTPEQRVAILSQLKQDLPVKAIASTTGASICTVCRLAVRVGLRRMYVTDQERAEVLVRRKLQS